MEDKIINVFLILMAIFAVGFSYWYATTSCENIIKLPLLTQKDIPARCVMGIYIVNK